MNLSRKIGNKQPKRTTIFQFLGLASVIVLMAVGCQKTHNTLDPHAEAELQKAKSGAALLATTDCDCCGDGVDSIVFNRSLNSSMEIGQYLPWGDTLVELCESGLALQFEGQFRSFVRVPEEWNLGTIDTAVTGSNFCTLITDPSFLQRCANTGGSVLSGYGPDVPLETVIGANGTSAGVGDMGLGFYDYPTRGNPRVIRDILIWKKCGETAGCLANDSTATIAYRLSILAITPVRLTPSGVTPIVYSTKIKYSWECLTTCAQ